VVSESQKLLGMVNELHILEAIQKGIGLETITASHLMVKPPLIAGANTTPEELIGMQLANRCCAVIPIIRNGKYVGLVSRHMLMDVFTSPRYSRFAKKRPQGAVFMRESQGVGQGLRKSSAAKQASLFT